MRRYGLLGFGLSVLAVFLIFTPPAKSQTAELTYETAKTAFDTQLLSSLAAGVVSNELDVFRAYLSQREFYQLIFPPMPEDLNQPAGLRVFDSAGFTDAFIKNLIPFECAPAIMAYRVVVREMIAENGRRYRAIFNAAEEPLSWGWTAQTYDPLTFLKLQYPQLMTDWLVLTDDLRTSQAQMLQDTYEPKRFVMALDLLPKNSLVKYVWAQSLSAEKLAGSGILEIQMMQMAWTGSTAYIEFVGLDLTNSAVWMTVGYPSNSTNRITFVACADLLQANWVWLSTTNPPANTNLLVVQDSGACTNRMFAAYNEDADSDGDGVADGREFYLDKTDSNNPNDPPNVNGVLSYSSGEQTGLFYIVAVTSSNGWGTNCCMVKTAPGAYQFVKFPTNTFYFKAFRDQDGDGTFDTNEAHGAYSNNPVFVSGQESNINIDIKDSEILRPGFDEHCLEISDDGYAHTGANTRHTESRYNCVEDQFAANISLGFAINYFGATAHAVYINNNGNLTFDRAHQDYIPQFLDTFTQIIAPFWADVDTRHIPDVIDAPVFYGTNGAINGHSAFAVSWRGVGYYGAHGDKTNTFQVVLVDRSDVNTNDFDLEFNYQSIEWETGDASGGWYGFGDSSAQVGFGDTSGNGFELPGSGIPGSFIDGGPFALAANRFNSNVDGRYRFRFRGGMPYHILRNDNMESNCNWTLQGAWAYGQPQGYDGDPTMGVTNGANVVGYNLQGAYATNLSPTYATMPGINCFSYSNIFLSFRRWLNVSPGDVARIEISTNNFSNWQTVWTNSGAVNDSFWQHVIYNVSDIATGSTNVRVRWVMGPTDGVVNGNEGGWNIDTVRVLNLY